MFEEGGDIRSGSREIDSRTHSLARTMSHLSLYEKVEKLGEGTYGVVYKVRNVRTHSLLALKNIRLANEEEGVPTTTIREVSLLKELSHPNIVALRDVVYVHSKLYLAFEFLEQDLAQLLDSKGRGLDSATTKSFLFQILCGVTYCHENSVLHRDLKPQNLLLDDRGTIKLADFGLARAFSSCADRVYTHEVITLWYRAPEIILDAKHYSTPVDVWSVGCIFAEMASGNPLFPGDSELNQIHRIFDACGAPTESSWPGVTRLPGYRPNLSSSRFAHSRLDERIPELSDRSSDLLKCLLVVNPLCRLTSLQALAHPFFEGADRIIQSQVRPGLAPVSVSDERQSA